MSNPEPPPELTAEAVNINGLYPRDNTWGNKIVVKNNTKAHGFITPHVSDGDTFAQQMESGRIAVYKLTNVDTKRNLSDMFFADVKPVAYLQEGEKHNLKPTLKRNFNNPHRNTATNTHK